MALAMFEQTITRALSRLGLEQRGDDPYPRQPTPMLVQRADKMLAEVEYRQRLRDGLRHAVLKGLRPEKKPGLIRRLL